MITKEKVREIKDQLSEIIQENKKLLIVATGVGVATMVLILNMHLFQMSYYTMKEETIKVTQILARDVQKEFRQDDWYFKKGIQYLTKNLSEESKVFLEENFKYFDTKIQETVIQAYTQLDSTFRQNQDVFHAIAISEDPQVYRPYMDSLSIEAIEKGLKIYLGESPKLTQEVVNRIYKILSLQPEKLTLEIFKLNVYGLMSFPHNGDVNSISLKLLDHIQPEAIKKSLFTELKTYPIEIEIFSTWIDILNKKRIISTAEYASFTSSYGSIRRMQEQYSQVLLQEVDLHNVKQMTDVQTEELANQEVKLTKEIEGLKTQNETTQEELRKLKNYKEIDLYVLDQYENGDYDVAIPERSWLFGTYKPSNEKIRLKITRTVVESQGVKTFKVYNRGKSQEGLPYYVEVSQEELNQVTALETKIKETNTVITNKEAEINKFNQEIAQIRKTNNYEQTLLLIEEVERKKNSLELEVKKEKVSIQNLFQIGELVVDIKKQ